MGTASEIAALGGAAPTFIPPAPRTIAETGLSQSLVEQLVLRLLYYRGELTGSEVANALGLMFSLLEPVLEHFKRSRWIEPKRSSGLGLVSTYVALTEAGRVFARQAVEQCQYSGVAPVPIGQYANGVLAQRLTGAWLSQEMLHKAFEGLVVSPSILAQIGPAVSSFSSFLIYGQPGNGKTYLAESLVRLPIPEIYLPYALEANGNLIQVFDPVYHKPQKATIGTGALAQNLESDGRWFRTKRPFIVSGGELTLDMLDLSYDAQTKIYDAPLHVKANNGIYLLDDFGRQRISPAEILNRWIVPMERKVDFLSLRTGGKVTIPFECLLVLSTNLRPSQIGDEAFLRRIRYKMLLRSPDRKEFEEIFRRICAQTGLTFRAEVFDRFLKRKYLDPKKPFRRCHPRDLIAHALDYIQFERLPYRLTDDVLDHAYDTTFVDEQGMEDG